MVARTDKLPFLRLNRYSYLAQDYRQDTYCPAVEGEYGEIRTLGNKGQQLHGGESDQGGGDHADHNEAGSEAAAVAYTGIGDFVNKHDKQAQYEGQHNCDQHFANRNGWKFPKKYISHR